MFKNLWGHKLFKNFIYLNFTQLLNYLFPFITFPYISRIFLPESYGLIITATSFAAYLGMLTDFGFNLSATRDLSKVISDKDEVTKIFNQILTTKIILFICFFCVFTIFLFSSNRYHQHFWIFCLSLIGVFGNVIFPTWYFQAKNTMDRIAKLNLISRLIGIICLFTFIHRDEDLVLFVVINSLISFFIGVSAILLITRNDSLRVRLGCSAYKFFEILRRGFASFTAVLLVSFYTTFNSILLSWFCNYRDVAIYGVADKVIGIVLTIQGVLIQSVFPSITSEVDHNVIKEKAKKLFKYNLILGVIVCLFVNSIAPIIIHILAGNRYDGSIPVLRILSLVPIIMAFSSSLSTYCFALKAERYQVYAYFVGVIFCISSNLVFIQKYTYFAVSINFILCEVISLILLLILLAKFNRQMVV